MSADESFLARWARRKRGAARKAHTGPTPKKTGDDAAPEVAASLPPEETQLLLDPASLPPIESIGAGSDIRPFLAAGVPADLAHAALRRAWSADLAIRDFVGLSENSWDFNALGGVPGFGSLTAEDAHRLLAWVMGEKEALDPAHPAASNLSDDQAAVHDCQTGIPASEMAGLLEPTEARPSLRRRKHGPTPCCRRFRGNPHAHERVTPRARVGQHFG
jgi:hypothetical protein